MNKLSQSTQKLINKYQIWWQSIQPKEGVATIHIDEITSGVASFYEKIRGIVGWKEEHLLRKTAIERVLKRRIFLGNNEGKIAEALVHELIRGGHFPNDRVAESKIKEVQKIIDKYTFIIENAPLNKNEDEKLQLHNWILSVAACEIEDALAPPIRENALMEYMTDLMKRRIRVREGIIIIGGMSEKEKNTQIYIAVQRTLFKLDASQISYRLLKKMYLEWPNFPRKDLMPSFQKEIAINIYSIWENIKKDLTHPLGDKFYQVCKRYNTPYLLLGDIISKDPIAAKEKISQPQGLENSIKKAYNQRLKTLKTRLTRAAFYATFSILLTNVLVLFAVEIPFTKYVMGYLSPLAIAVDILAPTFLIAFLVVTIRPPKKGNLERAMLEVMKITYERQRKDVYEIRPSKKRGVIFKTIITIFYLITFIISYGIIVWLLLKLNFPPLSLLILIIFISLIAFAGVKIRERSKELQISEEKGNLLTFIIDLFSLPLLQTGKWLSARFEKYNVIVVLFNSLIDMPFQIFIEFLEQWRYFLIEKKEEIH